MAAVAGAVWAKPSLAEDPTRDVRLGIIGVGNRGSSLLADLLGHAGTQVTAICDIDASAAARAVEVVRKARGNSPESYTRGPEDYLRMLQREDIDAVGVFTPIKLHAAMAIAAMKAGKHVLSEVPAAVTIEECEQLVRTAEQTRRFYMMAENCCYYEACMMVLEMVGRGMFGDLTYAECGYIHELRAELFNRDGSLNWRGEMQRDMVGNWYPTHGLGPVSQWLGINRDDRFVSLTAAMTPPTSLKRYVIERFGKDHPSARIDWRCGDSTTALIKTQKGRVIEVRFDIASPRPHPMTTHYLLQGSKGAYLFDGERIWIEGRSKGNKWEPAAPYMKEFSHPLWKAWGDKGRSSGHNGADYFVTRAFVEALRNGQRPPIDVYDAAAWSSVTALTRASIEGGGKVVEFPKFRAETAGS